MNNYRDSLKIDGVFQIWSTPHNHCENNLTVYKFTSEEHAKKVLRRILDCAHQYIEEHPQETYSICSEPYFAPYNNVCVFEGGTLYNLVAFPSKSIAIETCMDSEGFYVFISIVKGDLQLLPCEWKTLKSFVNGKRTYYKDKL
jgi:hypothetical protein